MTHSFPTRRSSDLCVGLVDLRPALLQGLMILAAHFGQPLAAGPAVEPALDPEMAGQSHRARIVERADREVDVRSEEHTSELQSLMRISYAVFCLKKKNKTHTHPHYYNHCLTHD